MEEILAAPLDREVHPYSPAKIKLQAGSTDVGDVAACVPTLNLLMATCCVGNVGHTWQMTAQACSPLAHKGMLAAAKVIALSGDTYHGEARGSGQGLEGAEEEERRSLCMPASGQRKASP